MAGKWRSTMLGDSGKCKGLWTQSSTRTRESVRAKKEEEDGSRGRHYWSCKTMIGSRRNLGLETESTVKGRSTALTHTWVLLPSSLWDERLKEIAGETQEFYPYTPGKFVLGGGWNYWLRLSTCHHDKDGHGSPSRKLAVTTSHEQ
ncbi:hypothetical protein D9613_003545 [Agrocybe pediades]|uniref:Uncharacterized protein n=1 Tax=Agrocybe pediades TaxID=84607 RepID=A0A8H4QS76_9AGAR|nr:hypothetical protein D9613_003545 [Agrocybe pediades]